MGATTGLMTRAWSRPVLSAALAGVALLGAAAPARALTLPPPDLTVKVNAGFDPPTTLTSNGPTTLTATDTANNSTATASVQISPGVLLSSTLVSAPVFASGGSAQGILKYDFAVTGPQNLVVPIHMLANLHATASVDAPTVVIGGQVTNTVAFSFATLGLFGSSVNKNWEACAKAGAGANPLACGLNPTDQAISDLFSITANQGVEVTESAYAGGNSSGDATASADPIFFIDPDFLSTHPGYELVFSPGVGNLAPGGPGDGVPEPATWAMMLLGFAGLGAAMRTRRRTAAS
jgi:hypothetical protein